MKTDIPLEDKLQVLIFELFGEWRREGEGGLEDAKSESEG